MFRAGMFLLSTLASILVPAQPLTLELRIFNGADDVTAETRLTVYRAGERGEPIARIAPRAGSIAIPVAQGLYDVQAIREKDGRVLNIRWAERLIVMPYPDEGGRHLEVINFTDDFGALQIRSKEGKAVPDVALFAAGVRTKEVARRETGDGYALFIAPVGTYDVLVRHGAKGQWHGDVEIPPDRTRLWIIP